MTGEGGTSVDARAAALGGGSRGAPAGVAARVLPGGYGREGDVMFGEWRAVVWSAVSGHARVRIRIFCRGENLTGVSGPAAATPMGAAFFLKTPSRLTPYPS
jgi:hypothetical protein